MRPGVGEPPAPILAGGGVPRAGTAAAEGGLPARIWLAAGGWLLPGQLRPPGRRARARGGQGPGSPASPALLSAGSWPWTHTQAPSQLCGLGLHFLGSPRPGQGGEEQKSGAGGGPRSCSGKVLPCKIVRAGSRHEVRKRAQGPSVSGGTLAASVPLSRCPPALRIVCGHQGGRQCLRDLPSPAVLMPRAPGGPGPGPEETRPCHAAQASPHPRALDPCRGAAFPAPTPAPCGTSQQRLQHLPPHGGRPSHRAPGHGSLGGWAVCWELRPGGPVDCRRGQGGW